MDLTQLLNEILGSWAGVFFAVVGVVAAIATMLPAPVSTSGTTYRIVYNMLNWLAMNFGKAKNADETGKR